MNAPGFPAAGSVPERRVRARKTLLLSHLMQLAELVSQYPDVRLATPADNARILAFFEQAPMHASA